MKNTSGCLLFYASASILLPVSTLSAAVTIDWVTVGNPGNLAQSASNRNHADSGGDGYGAVAYTYRMAQNETTIAQYAAFLNAVAATDTYGLYNSSMATDLNIAGISRSGDPGSYTYSVTGSGDRPITYVSWFDAARMANWMHNGQGSGDTETGAYTLNGATSGTAPAKNAGATVWIPTENEWFKAAYYDPTHMGGTGGYWLYGNQSDSLSSNSIGVNGAANYYDGAYAVTQSGSYSGSQNYLTDVGAYGPASQSYYWLNDVAGNVFEWNDLDGESGSSRGLRGGSWNYGEGFLRSSIRGGPAPSVEDFNFGFRFASSSEVSAIPEPTSILSIAGLLGGGLLLRSRSKRSL